MPSLASPTRRSRNRQARLATLPVLAGTLFARDGYDAVTMEQIAAAADVARGTLYNHFPSKEALLVAWVHQQLAQDLQALAGAADTRAGFSHGITALLDLSARWCSDHRGVLAPYLRARFLDLRTGPEPATQDDGLIAYCAHLISNSQALGEIAPGHDARQLATQFHYLYLGALMRWLGEAEGDLRAEFHAATALFLHGCACGDQQ